jgi:dihydroxyacetone kinase-like protein
MVTKAQILDWLETTANVLAENKEYLTELDSAIGDADHGINMDRGFRKVMEKLPDSSNLDIGGILKAVGMTLISTVGGASGPLYGTFYLQAGTAMAGKDELTGEDVAAMLEAGVQGILKRGRAQLEDKTMYDAWEPALKALREALNDGKSTEEALDAAVSAADEGMKATIPLVARKGRASYLGERSAGHQDPGATSSHLILKALRDVL